MESSKKILNNIFNKHKPVFLAPMAGIFDYPCRKIFKKVFHTYLPDVPLWSFTELISAKALSLKNKKTINMIHPEENNVSIQLFGNEPDDFKSAVEYLLENNIKTPIDINLGCSVRKVIKSGSGSFLLDTPDKIIEIIRAIKSVSSLPISIKTRIGYKTVTLFDFAEELEKEGIAFITLHPRFGKDMFSIPAQWDYIAKLKKILSIPVIGNGDIKSLDDASEMIKLTNCDGIMAGRSFIGRYFLPINMYFHINKIDKFIVPKKSEIISILKKHIEYIIDEYGEKKSIVIIRKHLCWGIYGFNGAKKIRNHIMNLKTLNDIMAVPDKLATYIYK